MITKALIISALLLGSSLFQPRIGFADGMVISPPDPYSDRWDLSNETDQQAFINYEGGVEKMILNISLSASPKEKYWLFPVPSDPTKVKIENLESLPNFDGEEISGKAKSNLDDIKETLFSTQIYPAIFDIFFGIDTLNLNKTDNYPAFGAVGSVGRTDYSGGQKDVTVYEHIVKEDITTETITAKTPLGLAQYFEDRNLKIDGTSIRAFNSYIGKDYTLVVSWINSKTKVPRQIEQRALLITFPTEKIFFPLKPTSVYGESIIPATVRVLGHVSPIVYKDIKAWAEIKYYVDNSFGVNKELNNFYSSHQNNNVKYTVIKLNSPSNKLTDDLWINKNSPIKVSYISFLAQSATILTVFSLLATSILAGIVAGLITFPRERSRRGIRKFALIGISNSLTLILVMLVSIFVNIDAKWGKIKLIGTFFIPIYSGVFLLISYFFIQVVKNTI